MSDPKLISPLLDNFIMGGPISDHHGIRCCPAMENSSNDKYIVKVISLPANPSQIDALLLTGAFSDASSTLSYFRELADDVTNEVNILNKLSELEGFLPYVGSQMEPMESESGFDIYLLSSYRRTLEKHFKRHVMTHLDALNLGLDLCAALSVCRRSGYLYVDLKPSNVFVTGERLYRIGDLGFIKLDSIKFASLPEKYFSPYTPPEIADAFSSLNTTMDTYAAGLILYQAYNNGALPFNDDIKPGDILPPPLYADYEMSEIILKACSPNLEERWQDPMKMGQAIINYMQRNGALDTPIVPIPEPVNENDAPSIENSPYDDLTEEDISEKTSPEETVTDVISSEEQIPENVTVEDAPSLPVSDPEDILDDIEKILSDDSSGSEDSESLAEDGIDEESDGYESVSDEVYDILNQADELASVTVPEPVVVPDPIDVPIPETVLPEDDAEITDEPEEETENSDATEETMPLDDLDNSVENENEESFSAEEDVPKKKRHWIRNTIIILILLALLAGGYYYYQNYYLLPIDSIVIHEGTEDSLTVKIKTDIDESLLQVICSDTYGNKIPSPVINGVAVFTGLVPDTAYSINVISNGFHRLVGNTATTYSTPVQSNIVQFDAVTGSTNGSVILSFTVEGPDCKEWTVHYSADGEESRSATFSSHIVTITDLTVGKEYTFQLVPEQDLYLSGQSEVKFTASNLIKADNLVVNSCINNTLDLSWTAPENESVQSWSVRCFNDSFSETIITTDTFATFHNIDHDAAFTVEVKAIGMSVGQVVSIPQNSVTVSNLQIDTSDPTQLFFTWDTNRPVPPLPEGWKLCYTIEGIDSQYSIICDENSALITPIVPNATYRIHLKDSHGNILLGSTAEISTGDSVPFYRDFDSFNVNSDDLIFKMCKTPDVEHWTRSDLKNDDFTTIFSSGERASFLVQITKRYSTSSEEVTTMYVIRNNEGLPIHAEVTSDAWVNMWYRNYCELDIPVMPTAPGEYTIEVFFDGGLVVSHPFTITE